MSRTRQRAAVGARAPALQADIGAVSCCAHTLRARAPPPHTHTHTHTTTTTTTTRTRLCQQHGQRVQCAAQPIQGRAHPRLHQLALGSAAPTLQVQHISDEAAACGSSSARERAYQPCVCVGVCVCKCVCVCVWVCRARACV
jgi:hypothetical protein